MTPVALVAVGEKETRKTQRHNKARSRCQTEDRKNACGPHP